MNYYCISDSHIHLPCVGAVIFNNSQFFKFVRKTIKYIFPRMFRRLSVGVILLLNKFRAQVIFAKNSGIGQPTIECWFFNHN